MKEEYRDKCRRPVGVCDSGVGGISVLKAMVQELPGEDFLFFGDSAHAPYGEKSAEEVRGLTLSVADHLVKSGAKALVVACNTATSVAISDLRRMYTGMPVIGTEPALNLAVKDHNRGPVLVMATPVTLRLTKFHHLITRLQDKADFRSVNCAGLADLVETGDLESPKLHDYLENLLGSYRGSVTGVVLGCTHYPFVKKEIRDVLGDIPMYDGGDGIARELRRELDNYGLLSDSESGGRVTFQSSIDTNEERELYRRMFLLDI